MTTGPKSSVSDYDLFLLGQGNHHRSWELLGAHPVTGPEAGVRFAVWAPQARRVSVIGDFNEWDGAAHPMQAVGGFGVWSVFVPGAALGHCYKYRVETADGHTLDKADPYAFAAELRPATASVVWDVERYAWNDAEWMRQRDSGDPTERPMSVYEVHLGSWRRVSDEEENGFHDYRTLAVELAAYAREMGYTHVELLPVTEHPLDRSWGYQVTGYYAPTRRFGTPDDFAWFVDYMHQQGIGVILDWVPSHFPRDAHALARFDGSALYEYEDTRKGEHKEWGTLVFNYGRNEVRNFLVSSALFWLDRYHVDGLRVDAVASMLYLNFCREDWEPNQYGTNENLEAIAFMQEMNSVVKRYFPGALTIAEDSSIYPGVTRPAEKGGLGFSLKWNMGWMNDTLKYIAKDPIYRRHHHDLLLIGLSEIFREKYVLPISHDEVVHLKRSMAAKMPGDLWPQMAGARLFYGFMWTHPGKKLLFMGQEWGVWREWDEAVSLEWSLLGGEPHRGLQAWVKELNRFYREEPALHAGDHDPSGLVVLDWHDRDRSILPYLRVDPNTGDYLAVVCNFTPVPRPAYRMGVPHSGEYREVLSSDDRAYWGDGRRNEGPLKAERSPCHGQPYSLVLDLPPLSVVVLKPAKRPVSKRKDMS